MNVYYLFDRRNLNNKDAIAILANNYMECEKMYSDIKKTSLKQSIPPLSYKPV